MSDTQTWEKAYEAAQSKLKNASPQSPTKPACQPEATVIPLEQAKLMVAKSKMKHPLTSTLYQKGKKPQLQTLYLKKINFFAFVKF